MQARILVLTDFHKRDRDSASIHGQIEAASLVQKDIMSIIDKYEIDTIIILGDWYHKGFHNLVRFWTCIQEDKKLSNKVNGEVYLLVGNHAFLESDANPERFLIQPNDYLKFSTPVSVMPDKPIFKVVKQLQYGGVQIDFFHYTKVNKQYTAELNENTTYHIGLYHDDVVLPGFVRQAEGYLSGNVSQQYLNEVYKNINLAICGHIHSSVGIVKQEMADGRTVPLMIPGALCITANTPSQRHEFVKLPILEINDDSTVTVKQVTQSLHTECMTFSDKKSTAEINPLMAAESEVIFKPSSMTNVHEFLKDKGYSEVGLRLINEATKTKLSVNDVASIITEEVDKQNVEHTGIISEEADSVY